MGDPQNGWFIMEIPYKSRWFIIDILLKWMIYFMENPIFKWMMTGGTPIYGRPHIRLLQETWFGNICETSIERQEMSRSCLSHLNIARCQLNSGILQYMCRKLDSHGSVYTSGSMQSSINLSVFSWLLVISNISYVSSTSNIDYIMKHSLEL